MTATNPHPVSTAIQKVMDNRHIPCATYRLQMNADFTFRAALEVSYYLQDLGITDLYLSPIFKARSGSMHGYDICDYGQLNPSIGSEADFDALAASLRERGMSIMLDMVPNHMGVADPCNLWWMDVLENGPSSIYARFFDIDWHPVKPELANKVVLPILGDQFGAVLENGELRLIGQDGAFLITYYDTRLPVNPSSYASILSYRLPNLQEKLGEDHADILELQSIITAANYLPHYTETDPEKVAERNREKEVIKRRIAALYSAGPDIRLMLDETLEVFNGVVGEPHSFDLLETVLSEQPYRPAFWRVASDEINYRRFFDINDMAAIRVELPEVFQAVHSLIYKLLSEGKVGSLRIDHPDGLWNPPDYFRRLQENYLLCRVESGSDSANGQTSDALHEWFEHTFEPNSPANNNWPFYVVVEKILSETEPMPLDWAVYGTTGYDFLNSVNGLFVNSANQAAFQDIYQRFIAAPMDFERLVETTKQDIMGEALASEIRSLSHQLERITEASRRYRDFTLSGLTDAIRDTIASMSIYRTYISDPQNISARDQHYIGQAIDTARRRHPQTTRLVFRFLRDTLLLQNLDSFSPEAQPLVIAFVMRLQQITGPVMAKSVEDTAFYVYNRLVSLNEVGGHPEQFGHSIEVFHQHNQDRSRRWPNAMLSTSTHDTKRSEDVRARIDMLSEMPSDWEAAIYRWSAQNTPLQTMLDEAQVPDHNDEYLFYQNSHRHLAFRDFHRRRVE